jgi:hypothetical protein
VPPSSGSCTPIDSTPFTTAGHRPGVYCNPGGAINIAANANFTGYSFVAATINVTSTIATFFPAPGENVVFDSTGNALSIAGTSNIISGIMCLGDGGGGAISFSTAGHPSGAYCLTGTTASFSFSGNSQNFAGYSFYAPNITVSGNGDYFCPGSQNADGTCNNFLQTVFDAYVGDLKLQGQNGTVSGNMFAALGNADIEGGGLGAGSGYLESQTLGVHGNFANFKGTGGGGYSTTTTPIVIPGTTTPGTTTPGTTTPGTTTPGTTTPGTTTPGTTTPDTTTPGTTTPGTTTPGTTTPDTTTPDTTTPDTTTPGTTTPGTTTPGTTTPGTTQTSTTGTNIGLGE